MTIAALTTRAVFAQVEAALGDNPQALEVLADYQQDADAGLLTVDRLRGFLQGLSAARALPYEDYCEVDAKLETDEIGPMINTQPLKRYLENVEQAKKAWKAVGAAYDAAPAGAKGAYGGQFDLAERAYSRACEELAIVVASQVKDAESAAR